MALLFLILVAVCVVIAAYYYSSKHDDSVQSVSSPTVLSNFTPLNDKGDPMPAQLLDLNTTTLAERQRAYGRSVNRQRQYDIIQRQAELVGDTETLEALRTNTYNGPLPSLSDSEEQAVVKDLQYFCIKDKGYHISVWPKTPGIQNLDYIDFTIAGMSYRENINGYFGEHLGTLEAEPTNPYDPNAIKILAEDGYHVGYVPKNDTSFVRQFTTLPCPCYFYIGSNSGNLFSSCYVSNPLPPH